MTGCITQESSYLYHAVLESQGHTTLSSVLKMQVFKAQIQVFTFARQVFYLLGYAPSPCSLIANWLVKL